MKLLPVIEASGKSRSEIIREVGFSQGYLSLLEQGKRSVGKKYLAKLADCLGVEPHVLRPDLVMMLSSSKKHGNAQKDVQDPDITLQPDGVS